MNEENNNPELNGTGNMNNMQNDYGTLPGLEQNGMSNDGFTLPGMETNDMGASYDSMNNQFGDPNQMIGENPGMDQFGMNQDSNFNGGFPGMGMDDQFNNMNPNMNGQLGDMSQGMDAGLNDPMNNQFGDPNQMMGDNPGMENMGGQLGDMSQGMDAGLNDPMNNQLGDPSQMMGGDPGMDQFGMNQDPSFNHVLPGMENMNPDMNGQFGDSNQMMGGDPGMDQFGMNQDPNINGGFPGMENMNPDMNGQFGDMNQGMNGGFNDPMNSQFGDQNQMMGGDPGMDQFGMNQDPNFNGGFPGMEGQPMGVEQQNYNAGSGDGDMGFVQSWMGDLYEKAHSSKFNWCAALFNGAYLLYRKMYTTGIIVLVLQLAFLAISMLLVAKAPVVGIIVSLLSSLGLFFGLGFGFYPLYRSFVKGKLNSLRTQVNDENQLMSIAEQKGGKSIVGVIIYYVAYSILAGVIMSVFAASAISNLFGGLTQTQPNQNGGEEQTNNQVQENKADDMSKFNFDENYYISYDKDWFLDEDNKVLTKGSYTLQYIDKYTKEQTNMDLSTADGRKQLLDYLAQTLTNQAAQLNIQVSTGNENFVPEEETYYNYIDFISADAIQRCYFVVLPEDNILFRFVLTINDTTVDSMTNTSVAKMLATIKKDTASGRSAFDGNNNNDEISNEVTNTLANGEQNNNNNNNNANQNNNGQANTNEQQNGNTSANGNNNQVATPSLNTQTNNESLSQMIN